MYDRQVSINCTIAYFLWALSVAIWGLSIFVDKRPIVSLAVILAIAAATATVRSYIANSHQQMKTALTVTAAVPTPVVPLPRGR